MEMYSHKCIKCNKDYRDDEIDPYYCTECNEIRKKIAEEVDNKFATIRQNRQQQEESEFQKYERLTKIRGSKFVNAKDLGIF